MTDPMHLDMVIACADLVGRAGAIEFQIGYAGTEARPRWWAHAQYRGGRLMAQDHETPEAAAYALSRRVLRGATCRCGKPVAMRQGHPNTCLWRLVGQAWVPGCDAPSVEIREGQRGDIVALTQAMKAPRPEAGRG